MTSELYLSLLQSFHSSEIERAENSAEIKLHLARAIGAMLGNRLDFMRRVSEYGAVMDAEDARDLVELKMLCRISYQGTKAVALSEIGADVVAAVQSL